jgi:hypothetical protein
VRFRNSTMRPLLFVAFACWLGVASFSDVRGQTDAVEAAGTPTDSEVSTAIETLKADPDLSQERKTKSLRWSGDDDDKPREREGFSRWLSNFFAWVGQLSRVLIWCAFGVLAIVLATSLYRSRHSPRKPAG